MATIDAWLARLSEENARVCGGILRRWMDWLRENGGEFSHYSPDELVAYQKRATGDDRYKILELAQAYVNSTGSRVNYKARIYTGIRSFFIHNRAELPADKTYTIRAPLEPVRGDLSVDEVKQILASCNKMYRAAFLSMFMGGMGLGELVYWSNNGYASLREQLDNESRLVRIDLAGRKKAKNTRPYHTYIGRDAIQALRDYLAVRPKGDGAIFYTSRGEPLVDYAARWYWNMKLVRLGFTKGKRGKWRGIRYGKNPHELRDLFRTRWDRSDVKPEAAEYFMGHVVDPLEYNKAYRDEEYTRSLYLKAEPWLNVLSEEPDKMSRAEVSSTLANYQSENMKIIEILQLRIEELEIERGLEKAGENENIRARLLARQREIQHIRDAHEGRLA